MDEKINKPVTLIQEQSLLFLSLKIIMPRQIHYKLVLWMRMFSVLRFSFAAVLLVLTVPAITWPHPHLFIATSYSLEFDSHGLAGIRVYWSFDEMYSSMTGSDFDKDKDETFNTQESGELIQLASEHLPPFHFFTNIEIDGQSFPVNSVSDFTITYESGQMDYEFFISCPVPASKQPRTVKIAPYDPQYSAAMFFVTDQPVFLKNSKNFKIDISIGEDPDKTIYFDMIHPETLTLTFQQKF